MRCPACGCKKQGTEEELACYWRNAHESSMALSNALLQSTIPECSRVVDPSAQMPQGISTRGAQAGWVTPVGGFVENNTYKFPGAARPSYAVEPTLPQGA